MHKLVRLMNRSEHKESRLSEACVIRFPAALANIDWTVQTGGKKILLNGLPFRADRACISTDVSRRLLPATGYWVFDFPLRLVSA